MCAYVTSTIARGVFAVVNTTVGGWCDEPGQWMIVRRRGSLADEVVVAPPRPRPAGSCPCQYTEDPEDPVRAATSPSPCGLSDGVPTTTSHEPAQAEESPMEALIETRGLHKRFGDVHAVRGIDLTVKRGTIYGLIGPNGAGKSTTLRMLVDIIRPTNGTITACSSR